MESQAMAEVGGWKEGRQPSLCLQGGLNQLRRPRARGQNQDQWLGSPRNRALTQGKGAVPPLRAGQDWGASVGLGGP